MRIALVSDTHLPRFGRRRPRAPTRERALRAFADEAPLDAIVFGHSHIPVVDRLDGRTWLVNPGSPTDKRRQPVFTWGLMTIKGAEISQVELRSYADRSP